MLGHRATAEIDFDQLVHDAVIPNAFNDDDGKGRDLPLLVPLSRDHPLLSASSTETFHVDAFLLSRPNTSLADLRTELREYLATLKEELVQLINDDYAAFISLRTDLRGEGPRLERLQGPLAAVKDDIERSRQGLQEVQDAIQLKLAERSALREEKTLLHLLLKVSDLVARLENMLLIRPPDDASSTNGPSIGVRDMNGMMNHDGGLSHGGDDEGDEHNPAVNRAKHLSRIAIEYSQLLYHADRARKQECAFVDELQPRIDTIQSTLARDLDVVFAAALLSLSNSGSEQQSTAARARAVSELSECLLIYETLERWDAAEDVIRHDIVVPFVKKTIHPGALSVPLSPVIPRTPLLEVSGASANPLTPSTPFTPWGNSLSTSNASHPPIALLPESEGADHLVNLLNTILRFVDRDCRTVVELAERANAARAYKRNKGRIAVPNGDVGDGEKRGKEEFDILGGVIWAEVGRALMDDLGGTLFAAGRPDDFQKNYTVLHEFISALEYAAPSADAVIALRENHVLESFEKRWQLPVYFQLRWKDIVGGLEDSLVRPAPDLTTRKGDGFFAPQARGIYQAVATCWSSTVFVPELGHRFWKLTLQILSRYKTWLEATLPMRRNLSSSTSDKPQQSQSQDFAEDDAHLRAFAIALSDIRTLQRKTRVFFADAITSLLPPDGLFAEDVLPAEVALSEVLSSLDTLVPSLSSHISSILTARCSDPLQHVRSQYRTLTTASSSLRRAGTPAAQLSEASYFVSNILKPLREFLFEHEDGPGVKLQREFGAIWAGEVWRAVITKYTAYLSGMKKTEDSLRRYNKSKRSTFLLFGSSQAQNQSSGNEPMDEGEARIRAQMMLDVATLGKHASALGGLIDPDASEEFKELAALAASSSSDGAGGS